MYQILRQTHLYCGLILLVFVVMYFVTGLAMTHGEYFPKKTGTDTRREQAITYTGERSPDALAQWAQATLDIQGRLTKSSTKSDGSWDLRFANAGREDRVQIPASFDTATITTHHRNAIETLNGLHRIRGYNGNWFYITWAVLYDLASASMIVFGITGVYMWYKLTRRRAFGWALLAASLLYPAAITAYLLLSR